MKSLGVVKTNREFSPSTYPTFVTIAAVDLGAQSYYIKLIQDLAPWFWARATVWRAGDAHAIMILTMP